MPDPTELPTPRAARAPATRRAAAAPVAEGQAEGRAAPRPRTAGSSAAAGKRPGRAAAPGPSATTRRPRPAARDVPAPGLREQGKQDKRRRILEAARAVFVEHGYEAATTREIAQRAGVSTGTVFVYARDKRDLLLQVVNDELDAVSLRAQRVASRPGPLVERLVDYFRPRYRYWASEPRLARPTLKETAEFLAPEDRPGEEATRFYARRPVMRSHVEQMVREAQAAGDVVTDVDADEVADVVASLYLIEVRRWLKDDPPRLAAGMARLEKTLRLFLRGVLAG